MDLLNLYVCENVYKHKVEEFNSKADIMFLDCINSCQASKCMVLIGFYLCDGLFSI